MWKQMRRVSAGIIILALTVLPVLPAARTAAAAFEDEPGQPDEKTFKVLCIGNSYTEDGTAYLYDIAAAGGYDDIAVGSATIGGASISDHFANAGSDAALYTYRKWTDNAAETRAANRRLAALLGEESWDVVILQEQSARAGQPEYYNDELDGLIGIIREAVPNPDVRFGWFMTWAYAASHKADEFSLFGRDQIAMYEAIADTVWLKISSHPDISFIAPAGTAIQNARTGYMGDTLNRDGTHLTRPDGQYLAGLCLFRAMTGQELPSGMPGEITALPPDHWPMLRESVENACQNYYTVTRSRYETAPRRTISYALGGDEVSIALSSSAYTYNAGARTPAITIRHGAKTLKKNVDYKVSYRNNVNAGEAEAAITGMGYYSGTVRKPFTISPKDINTLAIGNPPNVGYAAAAVKPAFALQNGSKNLVQGVDYSVFYKNNTAVGTASVTLKGMGNYAGTVEKTFKITIKPVSQLAVSKIPAKAYTRKAIRPDITVKNGTKKLKAGEDYTVAYKDNKKVGKASLVITGQGNYGGTATKKFSIKRKSIKKLQTKEIPARKYTGKAIRPKAVLRHNGKKLKKGRDYTVQYKDNIRPGTATVTIRGIGSYKGTVKKRFSIRY